MLEATACWGGIEWNGTIQVQVSGRGWVWVGSGRHDHGDGHGLVYRSGRALVVETGVAFTAAGAG